MPNPHLPTEILDLIVNLLHGDKKALRSCSLASRSWVERARRELFFQVEFYNMSHPYLWQETFQDSTTTPARYTKRLILNQPISFGIPDLAWIRTFSAVRDFMVGTPVDPSLFYNFSPVERIYVSCSSMSASDIVNLALSFPLLRDLIVYIYDTILSEDSGWGRFNLPPRVPLPSNLPTLAGTLTLKARSGLRCITPMLLSQQGDLRVQSLVLTIENNEDNRIAAEELIKCCSSVKSLVIRSCMAFQYLDRCDVT